jgi:hypothetical protein
MQSFVRRAATLHPFEKLQSIASLAPLARPWIVALLNVRFRARKSSSVAITSQPDFLGQFPYRTVHGYDWR